MISRRALLGSALAPACARAEAATPVVPRPDLLALFEQAGTPGTFAALRLAPRQLVLTGEARARARVIPASTYKIPNSLIALETGVVADTDGETFRWDGVTRSIPEWNRDHTLRGAIRYSVVPVYQEIARRIGAVRMQTYVDAFDYGNHDIGGGIDRFWLDGNLRISPVEQIAFLERFWRGRLPVSARTTALVKDIMPVVEAGSARLRAKSGAAVKDGKLALGWLVGWVGEGEGTTIFALTIDLNGAADLDRRAPLAAALLDRVGAL
jgi:beta-lactamase class D